MTASAASVDEEGNERKDASQLGGNESCCEEKPLRVAGFPEVMMDPEGRSVTLTSAGGERLPCKVQELPVGGGSASVASSLRFRGKAGSGKT